MLFKALLLNRLLCTARTELCDPQMTGQVKNPDSMPAPWRALQTHVGVIQDLAQSAVPETCSSKSCSTHPGSLNRTSSAAGGGIEAEGGGISSESFKQLWDWKGRRILRLPSDQPPRDFLWEAGLPLPPAPSPAFLPPSPHFPLPRRGSKCCRAG